MVHLYRCTNSLTPLFFSISKQVSKINVDSWSLTVWIWRLHINSWVVLLKKDETGKNWKYSYMSCDMEWLYSAKRQAQLLLHCVNKTSYNVTNYTVAIA